MNPHILLVRMSLPLLMTFIPLCRYRFQSGTLFLPTEGLLVVQVCLLVMNSFSFSISESVFFFFFFFLPSVLKDIFCWIQNSKLAVFPFTISKVYPHCLLSCTVSKEKWAVIFISVPLGVSFSSDYLIFSLSLGLSNLIVMYLYFSSCFLCLGFTEHIGSVGLQLSSNLEKFQLLFL